MYLVVDIGTSSMKAAVLDRQGRQLSYGRQFFPYKEGKSPEPELWKKSFLALSEVYRDQPVEAISISSNGPTLAAVDLQGDSLFPSLFWQDRHWIPQRVKSYYLPKVLWFRENHRGLYDKTDLFLSPSEYLLYLLTGEAAMATSGKSFTPFIWDRDQLDSCGLDREKFPSIRKVGSFLGKVNEKGSLAFGLPQGVPCYLMGSDFQASLLGTGAVEPGVVCDRAGTSEGLNLCTVKPVKGRELRTLPHVIEGMWNSAAILSSTGALFEWYRRLTGQGERSYSDMLESISSSDQDPVYFFPTLKHGGLWEFSGGMLIGLEPEHHREALGLAMLESIGFSLRRGIDMLERKGPGLNRIVLSGGQAKNNHWNQMKANLVNRQLLLPEMVDAELVGCACAAAYGLGLYDSLSDAAKSLVRVEQVFEPEPAKVQELNQKYRRYKKLSGKASSIYRKKMKMELDKK